MTALLDADAAAATADDDVPRLASWQARAGAIALDVLPGVAVITTMALLAYTTAVGGWLWWVFMVVLAARDVGDVRQSVAAAADHGLDHGPRSRRNPRDHRDGSACRQHQIAGARPRAPPRYGRVVRRLVVAIGRQAAPDVCGSVVAHRGSRGRCHRSAQSRRPADRGMCVDCGGRGVCCRWRAGLPAGISAGPGARAGENRDRRTGSADRRAAAQLRQAKRRRRLCAGADVGHRRLSSAAGPTATGRAEVGCHRQRILGGEQRGAVGDHGSGGDAVGPSGPTRLGPQESEVHHGDGAGRLREVERTLASRGSHRAQEAIDRSERWAAPPQPPPPPAPPNGSGR